MQGNGPERLTIFERLGAALRVPFPVVSLLFASLAGPPAQFFVYLIQTRDISESLRFTFTVGYTNIPGTIAFSEGVVSSLFWFATVFFGAYSARIMRMKIVSAELDLIQLSSSGEEGVHLAFGRVSSFVPVAILAALILPLSLVYVFSQTSTALILAYLIMSDVLISVIFGNWFWVFISSLWGLHKFGQQPLKLRSPSEDKMMGARPMGSIALTLGLVYFGLLLLIVLGNVFLADLLTTVSIAGVVVIGVVMFFLPLNSIHKRMVQEKAMHASKIRDDFGRLAESLKDKGTTEVLLKNLVSVEILQFNREEVKGIPTWPFDTSAVSRFAAIIFSVVAVLISREITLLLHI